jgi:Lrp/AsnC family transcriptional regulator, regulator for asnA, asnC and gidA
LQNDVKIDEIDAKMLRMLLAEARTTFTDISKVCSITVGAVRMRYQRLIKEGVITGEVTLVNPHCLGFRHIIDLGIITSPENEENVATYLDSKPYMSEMVRHLGKFSFYGKVALRDLNKLSSIIEDLEANPKITRVEPLIWAQAINVEYPQNLIIKPLPYNKAHGHVRPAIADLDQKPIQLDEIDRKIAMAVSKKARKPFRKIAGELGISTKTVIQRYKRLRENVLTHSTVVLDLNKLGYGAFGNLYIKVANRSKLTEIYNQLLKIPNVIVIIRLIGTYDLYVAVALENFDKMFETRSRLNKISGIEKRDVYITPMPPAWPFNLFPSLLENDALPKYWVPDVNDKPDIDDEED